MYEMKKRLLFTISLFISVQFIFAQKWTPLFDGNNTEGWEQVGKGQFVLEDGLLKTDGGMGLLYFKEQAFEDVVIRIVYKNPEGKNAGVFIRIPEQPTEPWMPVNKGYEVQIDDSGDEYHKTGVLYSLTKAKATPNKPGEWNTMEITLDGDRTMVSVNGELVTDYTEGDPVPEKKIWYEPDRGRRPTKGYIGLQNHGDEDVVYFKEISVRSLASKPQSKFWAHRYNIRNNISYGDDPQQILDIYLQGSYIGEPTFFKKDSDSKPTLVYYHGGGWVQGSKDEQAPRFLSYLERGWNVVNVEYRLGAGTAPNAAEDAIAALKWVAENAETYGIDKDKIVLSGGSAGGHLCLLAGLVNSQPNYHPNYVGDQLNIRAIINWFGITEIEAVEDYLANTLPDWNYAIAWIKEKEKVAEISKKYSPLFYISEKAFPILTIHGDSDIVVPFTQATLLHEALDKAGAKNHQLLKLEGGKHMGFSEEQFQLIYSTIFEFLEAQGL